MPDELPKGWVKTTLREICLPIETIQPKDSPDTEFTYFDIGGIDNEKKCIAKTKNITGRTAPSRARQVVRKGDILFSTVRTYLKNIALIDKDYPNPIASTGFTVIRPAEGVSSQFLFNQVLTDDFLQPLHELQTGSSYPAVRDSDVFAQPILLPPFAEQVRLAAKLSSVLSRIQRAETAALRARERISDYCVTVFKAAITGELTNGWRESRQGTQSISFENGEVFLQRLLKIRRALWEENELKRLRASGEEPKANNWKSRYYEPLPPITNRLSEIPEGWTWAAVEQLGEVRLGRQRSPENHTGEYMRPYLRVANVFEDHIDTSDVMYMNFTPREFEIYRLEEGDILLNEGQSFKLVGRPAMFRNEVPDCCFQNTLVRFRASSEMNRDYALIVFRAYLHNGQFQKIAKITTNLAHLGADRLARLEFPLPPLAEQFEIVQDVGNRLLAAGRLSKSLEQQIDRAGEIRQLLLRDAFSGRLVPQNGKDESAIILLERIHSERARLTSEQKESKSRSQIEAKKAMRNVIKEQSITPENLIAAFEKIGRKANAELLYKELGCSPEQVTSFYETLRATPKVIEVFQREIDKTLSKQKLSPILAEKNLGQNGHFRLIDLWLEAFKNLKDYSVLFDPSQGLDVVLGWNGTGKSNLFEALVIIFRDLHEWWFQNQWPEHPLNGSGYRLRYEIYEQLFEVIWNPGEMKRPYVTKANRLEKSNEYGIPEAISRTELLLPRFLFAYYSGPTNRLADLFQPMNQDHYDRLRKAISDDPKTLGTLLEQRRFFCAETHHAKYVLLAFSYKEDLEISKFLKDRLRIIGFESALFIIRKPRWAKQGSKAEDFWGATGIMRRVMERLRRIAIAPMVVSQIINDGYRSKNEDHYYFFLPDLRSLHVFAAEYENARTFFLALESTDFSELIYDLIIQVRIQAADGEQPLITFHQLSEGEQQLLMVLGLLRFTKSHQSLVLLDEPDTHLNPHWGVDYLKDLKRVMSDNALESPEQQSSQILIATHDPLVIASLVREQIHLLKRDIESLKCYWEQPSVDPRGLGFTGILTSEMFGFKSDLDPETMELLDKQVDLAGKDTLSKEELKELEIITKQVESLGFKSANSDPYYRAFIKAIVRRQEVRKLFLKPVLGKPDFEALKRETDEILKEIEAEEARGK